MRMETVCLCKISHVLQKSPMGLDSNGRMFRSYTNKPDVKERNSFDTQSIFGFKFYSRISHEYSSLFIIVINLIFIFSLWCIDWVGSLYANRIFMYFCIKSSIGTQGEVGWLWKCFNPRPPLPPPPTPVVCSADRSKAVVPVLVLLFVALWFVLRGDLLCVFLCVVLFLCFSVLLVLRLPRLGKRELVLVLFVRLFGLCLFRFVGFLFLLGSWGAAVCGCGTPWAFLLPFCRDKICLNMFYPYRI